MTHKTFFPLSLLLSASCLAWAADAPKTVPPSSFFPLAKGTTWAFRGPVEWQVGTEVKNRVVFWMMEVTATVEADGVLAACLKGHPDDMVWYMEGKEPSARVLLWNGGGYYNAASSVGCGDILKASGGDAKRLSSLISVDHPDLPIPLSEGTHWGDDEEYPRDDSMYRWNVEEIAEKKLTGIKGVDPEKPYKTVLVTYRCLGSHEFVEYAEGIGIIRYQFGHHGTVSECDMKLVEFRPGK
jgi:hypothetical protein